MHFKTIKVSLVGTILLLIISYVYFNEGFPNTNNLYYKNLFYQSTHDNEFLTEETSNITSNSFLSLHNSIVRHRNRHRVVFYEVQLRHGYGNRIYSMLSAFMVSVLTDSALLIKWPSIDFFIDFILKDAFKNFSDSSFLDFNQKNPRICFVPTDTLNTWKQAKQLIFIKEDSFFHSKCKRFYVSDYTAYFFDMASHINYARKLAQAGFVSQQTVHKAVQNLNNPKIEAEQKIEFLYMIGFEFGGHVLNNYWRLKPNLTRKVDNFIREKFSAHFVIGFHLRNYYLSPQDIELFIDCALMIENLRSKVVGNRKVKWFVASDHSGTIENLRKRSGTYKSRIIVNQGRIGHIGYNEDSYERALMDIELLSQCDEIIVTGGSTFGFIASLKSQKLPFVIEGERNATRCEVFKLSAPARAFNNMATF